jgi:hypothetical protein
MLNSLNINQGSTHCLGENGGLPLFTFCCFFNKIYAEFKIYLYLCMFLTFMQSTLLKILLSDPRPQSGIRDVND